MIDKLPANFSSRGPAEGSPIGLAPLAEVLSDRTHLDLAAARAELERLGIAITRSQIARWAGERKLPFFMMGKKLVIQRGELHNAIQRRQCAALRGMDRRPTRRWRRDAA